MAVVSETVVSDAAVMVSAVVTADEAVVFAVVSAVLTVVSVTADAVFTAAVSAAGAACGTAVSVLASVSVSDPETAVVSGASYGVSVIGCDAGAGFVSEAVLSCDASLVRSSDAVAAVKTSDVLLSMGLQPHKDAAAVRHDNMMIPIFLFKSNPLFRLCHAQMRTYAIYFYYITIFLSSQWQMNDFLSHSADKL